MMPTRRSDTMNTQQRKELLQALKAPLRQNMHRKFKGSDPFDSTH